MSELEKEISKYSKVIAEILIKGNDVEVRKSKDGIKVYEVKKSIKAS